MYLRPIIDRLRCKLFGHRFVLDDHNSWDDGGKVWFPVYFCERCGQKFRNKGKLFKPLSE